jgi:hypothetical protein
MIGAQTQRKRSRLIWRGLKFTEREIDAVNGRA